MTMAFTSNLLLASALLLFGFPAQAEIYYKYSRHKEGMLRFTEKQPTI